MIAVANRIHHPEGAGALGERFRRRVDKGRRTSGQGRHEIRSDK